ncbi:hypothetical protein HK103_000239 [Boothiomyces macroporosus]|uniref:Uncharacterized protein n=1 Tax=Boothiomyces macroporosus TaxID=261099 RepID=A0AAD5UKJ2_9FUNG|nr:hypothetical protein HK103_000239 [Boothiomyces macroporosus]
MTDDKKNKSFTMKLFTKKTSSVEPEVSSGLKRAITSKEGKRANEDDNNEILSSPSVLSKAMVFDFATGENKEHRKSPSTKLDSSGNVKDGDAAKSPKSARASSKDCLALEGKNDTMSPHLAKNKVHTDHKPHSPPLPVEKEDSITEESKSSVTKGKILKGVAVKGLEKLQFNTHHTNRTEYTDKIATVIDSPNTAEEVRTDRIRASIGSSPLVDRVQDPFAKKELSNLKMPIATVKILEDNSSDEYVDQKPNSRKESLKFGAKPKELIEKVHSPIEKPANYMQIDVPAAKYKPPPPLEDNTFVIETTSQKSSPAVIKNKAKGITIRGIEKLQFDVSQPLSLTDPATSSSDTKIIVQKAGTDSKRQSFPVSIADTVSIPSAGIRETDQFIFDEFVVKNSSIKEDKNETDTLDKTPLISPVIGKNPFSSSRDLGMVPSPSAKNIQGIPVSSSTPFGLGLTQTNTSVSKSSGNIVGNSGMPSGSILSQNSSQSISFPKSVENVTSMPKSPSAQNTTLEKSPSNQNNVGISKSPSGQGSGTLTKSPSNQGSGNLTKSPSSQGMGSLGKSLSNLITISISKSPSASNFKPQESESANSNALVNSKPDAAVLKREESFKHRKSVGSRPTSGIFDSPKLSDKSMSEAMKPTAASANVLNTPAEPSEGRLAISVIDLDSRKQSITSAMSSHPSTAHSSRSSVGPESARGIKNFQMQIDKPKMSLYPPPLIEEESTPEDSKNRAPDFKMKGITVRGLENFHVDTKLAIKSNSESELKAISPAIKSSSSEDEEGQTLGKQKKKSKPSLAKIPIATAVSAPEIDRENSDGPRTALISEIPNPFSENYTGPDGADIPSSSTDSPQQHRGKKHIKERRNSKVAQYIAEVKIDTIEEKPEIEKSKSNIAAWLDGSIPEERDVLIKEIKAKEESLKLEIEAFKKEKNELQEELNQLKERYSSSKDALNGDIIAAKQKYDTAAAQVSHLTLSYERVLQEKEQLYQTNLNLQCESNALKLKIEEQLAIHNHVELSIQKSQASRAHDSQRIKELEQKLEELNVDGFTREISDLQTKISRLMADLKCESLEKQALIDQQIQLKEATKVAIQRSSMLEQEIDSLKLRVDRENKIGSSKRAKSEASVREEQEKAEQLCQLENQVKMLKISVETKEANIEALCQRVKSAEIAALKHSENFTVIKEKHDNLEQLNMKRAHEIVQLGQDKSILQDELAECKNAIDRKDQKIKNLTEENKSLHERLAQLEAESSKWTEFANIVDQVETTGANYLAMMQGIKSKLGRV